MKKRLTIFLMLLIAVGCDDSAEIARLREQVEDLQKHTAEPTAEQPVESITNTIGMTLNGIPAGTFMMGSLPADNEHLHKVTISKAFYMQTTEVTRGQWRAVMGTEPRKYPPEDPNYAASHVSWDDAVAYCKKLSKKEGKRYRLPTEAEWEYACRAGTQTTWSFGNDENELGDYAWYRENASNAGERYGHQVGQKNPNAFGLYDMHGNVSEWCHDYTGKDYYKQSPANDPTGPASGVGRVLRGGAFYYSTHNTRSAFRSGLRPDIRRSYAGFRVVRELD